ncbi:WD40 repeat domain-containing protein [Actinosynnema sp. NPDC059335]|uniref:WD40 repeat domain-containing protein n=1 Tax=Actinosynnema sp. NPDC059335 TaxID=3346804 RepID=UPI0036712B7E
MHVALGVDRLITWRDNQDRLLVSRLDGTRVADIAMRPPTTPVGDVPPSWTFHLTADPGTLVARNTDTDEVHLLDLATGRTTPLATGASAVLVSADGRVLVTCHRVEHGVDGLVVFDLPSGRRRAEHLDTSGCSMVLDPTGRYLARGVEPSMGVLDLETGEVVAWMRGRGRPVGVRLGADGLLRVVTGDEDGVLVHRLDPAVLESAPGDPESGDIAPDGRLALTVDDVSSLLSRSSHLSLWRTDDHRRVAEVRLGEEAGTARFDPTGRYVAVALPTAVAVLRVPDLTEVTRLPLVESPDLAEPVVRFDRSGGLHVGHAATIRTWDLATGTLRHAVAVPSPPSGEVHFDLLAPDRALVVSADRLAVDEWDLITGRPTNHRALTGPDEPVAEVAVLGDGLLVAYEHRIDVLVGEESVTVETRSFAGLGHVPTDVVDGHPRLVRDLRITDYPDQTAKSPTLPRYPLAMRGDLVLTDEGLIELDRDTWLRHLCALVAPRAPGTTPPGCP